ncbi:hypothetical protein BCR32DRAFT_269248 [Anaeromyces robustus]|uniref:Uncharacterized protein n=1 Tax=Anaeromyces robustus TaxID=1754192 RepID=A0A1Y1X1U7_9FUNG|nr:hypothetical protein BCR32DRAFT_269248 [Anaeromyces robustus]|eukprot:ORX79777.1 hypothetical protein BCR32DRAFT_269248 [Anaeromyces robustus]
MSAIKYKNDRKEHSISCINLFIPHIPIKHYNQNQNKKKYKAFNTTAPRFAKSSNDLPGPGYYVDEKDDNYFVFSNKGFGVGFTSEDKRFKNENLYSVGPGKYSIVKMEQYYDHQKFDPCKNFKTNIANTIIPEPTPGPSDYNYLKSEKALQKSNLEKKMNYTFKSKTPRFPVTSKERILLAPGSYKIDTEEQKPSAVSSFKSSGRKKDYTKIIDNGPGPGHYFQKEKSMTDTKKSKLILGLVADKPDPSKRYHLNSPGPGYYDIQNGSKISEIINGIKKGQSFTNSKRFNNSDTYIPGPGYYQPIDNLHHSYNINNHQWI